MGIVTLFIYIYICFFKKLIMETRNHFKKRGDTEKPHE